MSEEITLWLIPKVPESRLYRRRSEMIELIKRLGRRNFELIGAVGGREDSVRFEVNDHHCWI